MNNVDIIIPLSNGSSSNNDELRLLLRSIERNVLDVRRIIICGENKPSWLQNICFLNIPDVLLNQADTNIINKVLKAIRVFHISGLFTFCSDDQCFMLPTKLADIPPIYNIRNFLDIDVTDNIWYQRVQNTMKWLQENNIILDCNYESHTPQTYNGTAIVEALAETPWATFPGYTISTLFHGLTCTDKGVEQSTCKRTFEENSDLFQPIGDKQFIGYNDNCFLNGLREQLFKHFPTPSRFEK